MAGEVRGVGVVGAGLMGNALAMEFARGGYEVWIQDASKEQLASAVERAESVFELLTGLGLAVPGEARAALERLHVTPDLQALAGNSDFVVEAVAEDLAVKQTVFARLDELCRAEVVLASNTSAFSPTALGAATKRPERVLVTHFFNPPYLLPAVEIVPGRLTSSDSLKVAERLCRSIGKDPVVLQREIPGFVANRLQFALYREASWLVEQGVVTADDLDRLVVNGIGNRLGVLGPIAIADLAGLDVFEAICRTVYPGLNDAKGPSDGLTKMVADGRLGAKAGRGFYDWPKTKVAEARRRLAEHAAMVFGKRVQS